MPLSVIAKKPSRLVIGLMSGTSLDGIDAALMEIEGHGLSASANLRHFITLPFPAPVAEELAVMVAGQQGGSAQICLMSFRLGRLYADACLELCSRAGVAPSQIDLVGCHGQTVWHQPEAVEYAGAPVRGTLQIGEPAEIAQALGCPVVSDFRVRDMSAGGQGAPLVPYTDYILYRSPDQSIALQNLGGIGNITYIPKGACLEEVIAFDTGPGNMVIDSVVKILTGAAMDAGGLLALSGTPSQALVAHIRAAEEDYLSRRPPKTTGRERYTAAFARDIISRGHDLGLPDRDIVASVTLYTALSIRLGLEGHCPGLPARLIVSGGGSHNKAIMGFIAGQLPGCTVLSAQQAGINTDAKEAAAFAILANERVFASPNNAPAATGARHPVVMGKVSL